MPRNTAIYHAKALYTLATQRGLFHDQHGFIDHVNGFWIASIGGAWLVFLRDNGATDHAVRYPS